MKHIVEEARRTPVIGEYEVVVLGGGPAGIAAAAAAGLANFCGLRGSDPDYSMRGSFRRRCAGPALICRCEMKNELR